MVAKQKLDTSIEPEIEQLSNTVGSNFKGEIIGKGVMYTVGYDFNCIVDREWLISRMNDLELPEYLQPTKPTPHSGYSRAMKRMREHWLEPYEIDSPRLDTGFPTTHTVEVSLKEGDDNIWHVHADVFFEEDEVKQEGGKWVTHTLGYFNYDVEGKNIRVYEADDLDEKEYLYEVWNDVSQAAIALFRQMQVNHMASDIRNIMYYAIAKHTNTVVKLQNTVYLFPAGLIPFVDKMAQLYKEINERFKETGEPVAVRTFEVLNTRDKREWIQQKVEEKLRDNIDSVLDEAFDSFDEGDTAETAVNVIRHNLGDSEETAEMYNSLLRSEIDLREELKDQRRNLADSEKEEILSRVLDQAEIEAQ